jgi:hypothetical protein
MYRFNLESAPLEIKTHSDPGSGDRIRLYFYNEIIDAFVGFEISFESAVQLKILYCGFQSSFPDTLPPTKEKIWRITLDRTVGVRLLVHCNEEEMFNIKLSGSLCWDTRWRSTWLGSVKELAFFSTWDTASDYYRPFKTTGEYRPCLYMLIFTKTEILGEMDRCFIFF